MIQREEAAHQSGVAGSDMNPADRYSNRALIRFFLPILAFNLIEVGFGVIDTIWVGILLEAGAIGATSICLSVTLILLGLASGIATAATVLVARSFGAHDTDHITRLVENAFGFSLLFAGILTAAGIYAGDRIVDIMGTPASIRAMTHEYLILSFITFFFTCAATTVVGILRGIGDSKTPMKFMMIGAILNTILVPLLITGLGPFPRMGLNGSMVATLLATLVALSLAIAYIYRSNGYPPIQVRRLALDIPVVRSLMAIGMPSVIQNCIPPLTGALLMAFVTPFGTDMVDMFGAVRKVDSMALLPALSMGTALSVFVSQLLGKKASQPIFSLFRFSCLFMAAISAMVSLAVIVFSPQLLSLFGLGDRSGIVEGMRYLTIAGSFYICQGIMATANGVLIGAGKTASAMLTSFTSQFCLTGLALLVIRNTGLGIHTIWWTIAFSSIAGMGMTLVLYYRKTWLESHTSSLVPG